MTALNLSADDYGLLTDLYQLTMAAAYVGEGIAEQPSSFELTVRRLPLGYGYLVAMGLAQVVDYLENFHFSPEQIAYLQSLEVFQRAPASFWTLLAGARFSGNLWAVPEGTVIFAHEPILRIEAPLWQAQILETYILNTINYQTLIATRAARLRDMVGPKAPLLEFGTRRAFSPQASLWAARAALAGGFTATSNVLASQRLGVTPAGTMAHALVMALEVSQGSEQQAFTTFSKYFPGSALLIDTFDTIAAAEVLAQRREAGELEITAVRIDSGDLVHLSQQIRQLLPGVSIVASGDLDETEIMHLQAAGACIDAYGIGTKLVTGTPVNGVYKLVEFNGKGVMKESSGKMTLPGRKQIFRSPEADTLGLMTDTAIPGVRLLMPIIDEGKVVTLMPSLGDIRQHTRTSVANLPTMVRINAQPEPYPVAYSPTLQELVDTIQRRRALC